MESNKDAFGELRATLNAMMKDSERFSLAWAMMSFLDRGQISGIRHHAQPMLYKIAGVQLADVADLIATVENPLHVALLELSVLGQVNFVSEKTNLRFFAVERAA